MHFQPEFYLHIICGHAGSAAPLMARLALSVGHDDEAHPFLLRDLNMVGHFDRQHGTQGLNEFYAMECARAVVLRNFRRWDEDQVEKLQAIALQPLPSSLDEKFPLRIREN